MSRARRLCADRACRALAEVGRTRCQTHEREAERRRGTPAERGYGPAHQKARQRALRRSQGLATCPLCGGLLHDGSPLELHHSKPLVQMTPAERAKAPPGDQLVHARCNPRGLANRAP